MTLQSHTYRRRDLPVYLAAVALGEIATLGLSVAIGWTVYDLTREPLALGIVGIVQFVPMVCFTLVAGELSDRISPRRVLMAGLVLQALCGLAFLLLTVFPQPGVLGFYAILMVFGTARAFADPASHALLPFLLPPVQLPRAIAWNSTVWQTARIGGPALGGFAYALGPGYAYTLCGAGFLAAMLAVATLGGRRAAPGDPATLADRIARVGEGLRFIRAQPIILGAISLDLFAVLLGGSTALLPIYASDILHVGPVGLGLLRSAPAVGACAVALVQARRPPDRNVGRQLFVAVAIFGLATLAFAFSTAFLVSLAALFVLGASDIVSVNIRSSLVQLATPDAMRGRVSSVNMLFIGASNELGEFESGIAAALLGTVPAVVLGGLGTLVVVAVWIRAFPALWKADRLLSVVPAETP